MDSNLKSNYEITLRGAMVGEAVNALTIFSFCVSTLRKYYFFFFIDQCLTEIDSSLSLVRCRIVRPTFGCHTFKVK